MPSCWATRRASSTSATEQHPESDGPPHSLRVAPTTSWPASTSRAAATDESTPPDMATSTRTRAVCHRRARRPHDNTGSSDGDADQLRVQVLGDALSAALPTQAALLRASERCRGRGGVDVVHTDDAEAQALHHPEGPSQ